VYKKSAIRRSFVPINGKTLIISINKNSQGYFVYGPHVMGVSGKCHNDSAPENAEEIDAVGQLLQHS